LKSAAPIAKSPTTCSDKEGQESTELHCGVTARCRTNVRGVSDPDQASLWRSAESHRSKNTCTDSQYAEQLGTTSVLITALVRLRHHLGGETRQCPGINRKCNEDTTLDETYIHRSKRCRMVLNFPPYSSSYRYDYHPQTQPGASRWRCSRYQRSIGSRQSR